ncbi:uncharacterized protein LOC109492829 [Felis catus]|uniref:uncharacterized protein LOC109492829 n=1 Tax=Felis catus TaxID=9685 RepID=UPI001D198B18|nr:uncharacterized protein LOC109492829 [Felis catus]
MVVTKMRVACGSGLEIVPPEEFSKVEERALPSSPWSCTCPCYDITNVYSWSPEQPASACLTSLSHRGVEGPSSCHLLSSARVHGGERPSSPSLWASLELGQRQKWGTSCWPPTSSPGPRHGGASQDGDHTVGAGSAGTARSQVLVLLLGVPRTSTSLSSQIQDLPGCVGSFHHEISKVLLLLYEKRAQEGTGEQALACEILILLPQLRNAPPTNPSPSSCVPFLLYLSWEDAASVGPGPQAGSQQLGTPIVYDKNFECPPRGFPAGGISPASGKWNLGWGPTASMPHPTCPARSGGGPLGSSILGRRWLCSPDPQRRVALWR